MPKNKYEKLINLIKKDYVESKKVNEAVELLLQINFSDIKKEHYTLIEDFIVTIVLHSDISEVDKQLLDKPLFHIRDKS